MLFADSSTTVTLTDEEWAMAVEMGNRRNGSAKGQRETDGRYNSSNALSSHIWGAGGEIAAAKYYEVSWDATFNGYRLIPDLHGCEVRSSDVKEPWLRIKKTDRHKRAWPFIYTTHSAIKVYRIEGWCYGWEGIKWGVWRVNKYSKQWEWHVAIHRLRAPFTFQPTISKLQELEQGGFQPNATAI